MARSKMQTERRGRLPSWLPQWVRQRIEIDEVALHRFVEQAGTTLKPRARVLDAGAGEGKHRSALTHTRYVGIDLTVGDCTWDYGQLDVVGDLMALPIEMDTFDAVLCIQVLEHVREPLQVLREIRRVLKPRGQLFLSVPQSWHQHQKPHDYYRYTSFGLRYLLERSGFKVDVIEPIGGYFWFLSFQLQNVNYWLFPRSMPYRTLTWLFRALLGFLFQLILPLGLYYLDGLDRVKDETLGYLCVAVAVDESGNSR